MNREEIALIVGADGWIGRSLVNALTQKGKRVLGTTRRAATLSRSRILLDLSHDPSRWKIPVDISTVFLCAAVTSQAACRQDPSHAALINVQNTLIIAERLLAAGAFVIFLSTDKVFDGSKAYRRCDEETCPIGDYGKQKAQTEKGLMKFSGPSAVVRMTRVIVKGLALHEEWISALKKKSPITPFRDMRMAPIPMPLATEALCDLAEHRLAGITQLSGENDVSYADAAYHVAERLGAPRDLVRPVDGRSAGLPPEMLPIHTTLDSQRAVREIGFSPPKPYSVIDWLLH